MILIRYYDQESVKEIIVTFDALFSIAGLLDRSKMKYKVYSAGSYVRPSNYGWSNIDFPNWILEDSIFI